MKIRTPIVAFTDNGAEVVCKSCGKDVPIDLLLGDGLRKSMAMVSAMLVVPKIVDTVKPRK